VSADEITLRLPRERPFFGVAHLVLGGLAVRLDVSIDQLEDVQVALAELLEQHESDREITLTVRVEGETMHAALGPFDETLEHDLARQDGVGLRRVLDTVVDDVQIVDRGGEPWVELTKVVRP
jgi:anti-sigma regulatory factor (Ser/Thr protein kinase)